MRAKYFDAVPRPSSGKGRHLANTPPKRCGTPAHGRIVRLFVGHGHGFIRMPDDREVFFHRADVEDGSRFNDFDINDIVSFELFEDPVSGARALRVRRSRRRA
jgi:cold shock CspA family protein